MKVQAHEQLEDLRMKNLLSYRNRFQCVEGFTTMQLHMFHRVLFVLKSQIAKKKNLEAPNSFRISKILVHEVFQMFNLEKVEEEDKMFKIASGSSSESEEGPEKEDSSTNNPVFNFKTSKMIQKLRATRDNRRYARNQMKIEDLSSSKSSVGSLKKSEECHDSSQTNLLQDQSESQVEVEVRAEVFKEEDGKSEYSEYIDEDTYEKIRRKSLTKKTVDDIVSQFMPRFKITEGIRAIKKQKKPTHIPQGEVHNNVGLNIEERKVRPETKHVKSEQPSQRIRNEQKDLSARPIIKNNNNRQSTVNRTMKKIPIHMMGNINQEGSIQNKMHGDFPLPFINDHDEILDGVMKEIDLPAKSVGDLERPNGGENSNVRFPLESDHPKSNSKNRFERNGQDILGISKNRYQKFFKNQFELLNGKMYLNGIKRNLEKEAQKFEKYLSTEIQSTKKENGTFKVSTSPTERSKTIGTKPAILEITRR